MVYAEKYKQELQQILASGLIPAVVNGIPKGCSEIDCKACDLMPQSSCIIAIMEWMCSEVRFDKFNVSDYSGNYVMHCNTKEDAEIFCNYLHSAGMKWVSGWPYLEYTHWDIHGPETVYCFNEGTYSDKSHISNLEYKMLEFDDFDWADYEQEK